MSHLHRVFIYSLICLFVLLIYSFTVYGSVVLNEVAIQPNQAVELYNTASTSADISSWYIDDAGGTTYYTVPSQTIIPPLSCLVFDSDFNFNKSSSDTVRLFDNTNPPITSSAKLVESYPYTKAPDSGYSFAKKMDGGNEWQNSISSLGLSNESLSPCVPPSTPTPFPTAILTPTATPIPTTEPTQSLSPTPSERDFSTIFISEVFPFPETGEHEWIEIYNGNEFQVHLENWYVDDVENGGSTPKSFTLKMDPYSYGVIELTSSLFNNSGDTVRLLNKNKTEKDSMEYGKISQKKSMGRISFSEDSYCEQEPSKNTINFPCIMETTQPISPKIISANIVTSIQKTTSPTKKPAMQLQQQTSTNNVSIKTNVSQDEGELLGAQTKEASSPSPTPYLSFVSFSYSLLTILSVFIKIKNA